MTEQFRELQERQAELMNESRGDLQDGIDCPVCLNRGVIFEVDSECYIVAKPCKCMARREAIRSAKRSGAEDLLKIHSFDKYEHGEKWQATIFDKAKTFAELDSGMWFIGGQVGAGKTAISISILNRLLERGKECRYFVWQNLVTELNRLQVENYGAEYEQRLDELAKVPVLYIDDFIRDEPSKAEIKLAYRIINSRYMATLAGRQLITLISSQRTLNECLSLDEAIGSRMCEMAGEYVISISRDEKYNYRMRLYREKLKKSEV